MTVSAEFAVTEGAGHMMMLEEPDRFDALLPGFLHGARPPAANEPAAAAERAS